MNICILNSVHPANDTRVLRIASSLAEAGHNVTIVSPLVSMLAANQQQLKGSISFVRIQKKVKGTFDPSRTLAGIFMAFLSRFMVSIELFRYGWRFKADIYHCNEVDSWFIGIALKILLRKRVVFDVHEYYPPVLAQILPTRWLRSVSERLLVKLFSISSRLTDGAIFVNRSMADLYQFRCKQVVVRSVPRLRDFKEVQADPHLKQKYDGHVMLLHVGRMRESYGAKSLIEAMILLQERGIDVICVILGGLDNSDDTFPDVFWRRLGNLGLLRQVEIVEEVPFHQVINYMEVADVGLSLLQPIHKNFIYSLGRKFLEYIASGLPIVASKFPEMRRLVEQYNLGLLVDPENPQEIARAIEILVRDPDLRQRFGKNARTAFELELNWEKESEHLHELYASWCLGGAFDP